MKTLPRCDVAVVGGGPAGVAAALASASLGAYTRLFERDDRLGGNATHALVHTLCGLYEVDASEPRTIHPGIPARLVQALQRADGAGTPEAAGRVHYLPMRPPVFAALVQRACEKAAGLETHMGTALVGAAFPTETGEGGRLSVEAPDGPVVCEAAVVVDTSGEAAAAHLARADTDLAESALLQRPSFIFRMEGVEESGTVGFARLRLTTAVARAAHQGELPEDCESLVVRSDGRSGSLYATLTLPPLPGREYEPLAPEYLEALATRARDQVEKIVTFLRATRTEFARAEVADWPTRVGVRETRRLRGRVVLERDDVLQGRSHPDEVARSSWPIELWEDHRRPRFEVPEGSCSVPLGSLVSRSHPNLGAAGRCLSASHEALGALRVIGTALATGQAIGVAAALAADAGTMLAEVDPARVREHIDNLEVGFS